MTAPLQVVHDPRWDRDGFCTVCSRREGDPGEAVIRLNATGLDRPHTAQLVNSAFQNDIID